MFKFMQKFNFTCSQYRIMTNLQVVNGDMTSPLVIPFSVIIESVYFHTLYSKDTERTLFRLILNSKKDIKTLQSLKNNNKVKNTPK